MRVCFFVMAGLVPRLSGSRFHRSAKESSATGTLPIVVTPGLVPGVHVFSGGKKNTWMPVTSTGMTTLWSLRCLEAQPISLNRTAVGLSRASTCVHRARNEHVDGRDKPGHDDEREWSSAERV